MRLLLAQSVQLDLNMMRKLLVSVAVLVLALGWMIFHNAVFVASAASSIQKITITPTAIHEMLKPNSVTHGAFAVTNGGKGSLVFNLSAAPYSVKNYTYDPVFIPIPGRPNVASWISFSKTQGTLQPNQSVEVDYTVTVPQNTPPGGYYAVAFAETPIQSASNLAGINLYQRVGYIFYIQIPGPAQKTGGVSGWDVKFLQQQSLTSTLFIEDSGSLDYMSAVHVNVQDIFGATKYSFNGQKVILPQTIRKVALNWGGAPPIAFFKIKGSVTVFGQSHNLPTKYVLVMSNYVRVIVAAILFVVIILPVVRYLIRRKRSRGNKNYKV
jgi:hypothetical protein